MSKNITQKSLIHISPSQTLGGREREFEGVGRRHSLINQQLEYYTDLGLISNGGKPRLGYARTYFLENRKIDLEGLVDYYLFWRDYNEYLVLQKQTFTMDKFTKETIAVKCSKRGNDVYRYRIKKKFSFMSIIENKVLFDWKSRNNRDQNVNTLFITLTFNPILCNINEAWESRVGKEYNRWITNLRNKFGKVEAVRTFEGYSNGYPHIHVVLIFGDHTFKTFKDNNGKWRVEEKEVFEHSWKSFVDVQALKDFKGGLFYLTKHILKNQAGSPIQEDELRKYNLTLALNWVFRKRSFSVSRGFVDLMNTLHNSNSIHQIQLTLEGSAVYCSVVWVCLGIFSSERLGIFDNSWSVELNNEILNEIM